VDENAEIVFGAAIDEDLSDDEVKVTVIATGFQPVSRRHEEEREPAVADHLTLEDYQRGWSPELPQVDTELPAFLRRNVTAR
jgi:cell division GTPase FtsZ